MIGMVPSLNKNWIYHLLLVGTGGFIGSILRFSFGNLVHHQFPTGMLPYGTLGVNVVGCLVMGFLGGITDAYQIATTEFRLFLFVGLLGGFTTFSAFGYETLTLMRTAEPLRAVSNIGLQLVFGLAAVSIGYSLGNRI